MLYRLHMRFLRWHDPLRWREVQMQRLTDQMCHWARAEPVRVERAARRDRRAFRTLHRAAKRGEVSPPIV